KAFQNLLNRISKEEDESLSKEEEDKSLSEEEEEEDKLLHSELIWREALRWAAGISGFVVLNS
ncbi:TMV resistance protein N-like, partial [Trifolium medium]|nr:TMV resistance protein N-like [Trifolium medium]